MYSSHIYPQMLRNLIEARVMPRVVETLRYKPMTARELSHHLRVANPVIKLALTTLRAEGYRIENRGSKGGAYSIKGTYHLVKEPSAVPVPR